MTFSTAYIVSLSDTNLRVSLGLTTQEEAASAATLLSCLLKYGMPVEDIQGEFYRQTEGARKWNQPMAEALEAIEYGLYRALRGY